MDVIMDVIKKLLVIGFLVGAAVVGKQQFEQYNARKKAGEITVEKIAQLKQGMTRDEVVKLFGNPTRESTGGGLRETGTRLAQQTAKYLYYRGNTVMLCLDANGKLIEVVVGENTDDYYSRKKGQKVLWQSFPGDGFIHNDVQGGGGGSIGGAAAGIM